MPDRTPFESKLRRSFPPAILLAALIVSFLPGCGSDAPEMVPVSGKVTLDGGPWPKPGIVFFTPLEPAEGFPRRPGMGHFDTDGVFTVTTRDPGDGLIPGTYRIAVECWEVEPTDSAPGKSYTSEWYIGQELTVEPGDRGPIRLEYDVPGRASGGSS